MKSKLMINSIFFIIVLSLSSLMHAEALWVDVRSVLENKMDNIEGDINIPHEDIVQELSKLYPDKKTEINVYCRSGGRAEKAMTALQTAGYTNVKNSGGIADARSARGIAE